MSRTRAADRPDVTYRDVGADRGAPEVALWTGGLGPMVVSALIFLGVAGLLLVAWRHYQGPTWTKIPVLTGGIPSLVCGSILCALRPDNRPGRYVLLFGTSWYLGILQAFGEPEVAYAVGFVFYHLNIVVLAHLALLLPYGKLQSRAEVAVISAMYVITPAIQLLRYLEVRDQIDRTRFGDVASYYSTWAQVGTYVGLPLTVVAVFLIVRRWAVANELHRRSYALFWISTAIVGVSALVALGVEFTHDHLPQQIALVIYTAAVALAPFGVVAGVLREVVAFPATISVLTGNGSDGLSRALARAIGDPRIRAYEWAEGSWLDDAGQVARPEPTAETALTEVSRHGEPVALIAHDRVLHQQQSLMRACASVAVTLVERRRAERRHREAQLALNVRWLQGQLDEQERIQGRLHDQAQGELMRLRWAIEKAEAALPEAVGDAPAEALRRAQEILNAYADRLSDFVKSLYPADLRELGLLESTRQLAMDLPLPVRVTIPDARWPDHVQLIAYLAIAEALNNIGKHAGASSASVRVATPAGELLVEIADDGVGGALAGDGLGLSVMRTRVEAVGGRLEIDSPPGGTKLTLHIPLPAASGGETDEEVTRER